MNYCTSCSLSVFWKCSNKVFYECIHWACDAQQSTGYVTGQPDAQPDGRLCNRIVTCACTNKVSHSLINVFVRNTYTVQKETCQSKRCLFKMLLAQYCISGIVQHSWFKTIADQDIFGLRYTNMTNLLLPRVVIQINVSNSVELIG